MICLTTLMHNQIYGLFDDGFSDSWVAATRVARIITSPPPKENLEKEDALFANKQGTGVLYLWSTLVMRLCFGSFTTAILVGAFNKVAPSEGWQSPCLPYISSTHRRPLSSFPPLPSTPTLPPDLSPALRLPLFQVVTTESSALDTTTKHGSRLPPSESVSQLLWYVLSARLYATFGARLVHTLEGALAQLEREQPHGQQGQRTYSLTAAQLVQLVGQATATQLLEAYGEDASSDSLEEETHSLERLTLGDGLQLVVAHGPDTAGSRAAEGRASMAMAVEEMRVLGARMESMHAQFGRLEAMLQRALREETKATPKALPAPAIPTAPVVPASSALASTNAALSSPANSSTPSRGADSWRSSMKSRVSVSAKWPPTSPPAPSVR